MSDRDRFKARVRFTERGVTQADVLTCPDCTSEYTVVERGPGIAEAFVKHDESCPWLAELQRDLS